MLAHGRVSLSVVIYYFRAQFIFYDLYGARSNLKFWEKGNKRRVFCSLSSILARRKFLRRGRWFDFYKVPIYGEYKFFNIRFARFIAVVTMETRKRIGSNESPDGGEISYIDVGNNLTLITSRRAKGRHGMPRTVSWRL